MGAVLATPFTKTVGNTSAAELTETSFSVSYNALSAFAIQFHAVENRLFLGRGHDAALQAATPASVRRMVESAPAS